MNSFEFNKFLGAFLGVVFVIFSVGLIADSIFATPHPEREGFEIAAGEEAAAGGATEAPAEESIAVLLASADATAGQAIEKKCAACHTTEKGGSNKVGPNLWNIVNRPIATHEGFAYSEAMAALKDKPWSYEALNEFITSPKTAVPGTKMAFGGLKKDADRANLLAYLQTLSDAPVPFPAP